jgi:UDP-3-O-[3-hydroxymyristoyl] glucosamine N-acyltransferase
VTFLANPKYTPQIEKTGASAIFLNDSVAIERPDIAVLRAPDAYVAYTLALRAFFPEKPASPGIHSTAVIDESAVVSDGAEIGANVVIAANCRIESGVRIFPNVAIYEGVTIGKDSVIHSGVSVRENCEIGERCMVHNNSTIGSDGFGYAKTADKKWLKIPQVGRVVLEDEVEIGANTAIDCASVGESRIKRGTKIDNLVQIGHSCTVDEDSLICAQTGLAGSSFIGKRVVLAGQVGIAGHLKVGDDVVITAKSATSHDVENGKVLSGVPAFDNRDWLRSIAAFRRLGDLAKKVRELEKRLTT